MTEPSLGDWGDDERGMPRLPPDLREINVRDFFEDAVRRVPDRLALIAGEHAFTYSELNDLVDRAASAWQAIGVTKGTRVAFLVGNCPEFIVAALALAKIGAILVALNTRLKAREVELLLETAKVRLFLADEDFLPVARLAAREVKVISLAEFMAAAESASQEFDRPAICADDVVSFIFTSGTTGRSKAVMQSHGNYVLTGQAYPWWLELEKGSCFYCCLPLFHVNAQAYSTMGTIGNEGTLVLAKQFSASTFWSDVSKHRANVVNYIGAMIAILMKRDPSPDEREHELRIAYGAPKFPEPQLRAIEDRFGITLVSGFGMSETTFGLVESLRDRPPGSVGKPRLHPDARISNDVRVVNEAGGRVGPGEVGELVIRNPMIMKGYFDQPKLTAEAIREGFLYTGDYASVDADGFFYFVDRKKDIVRRRGENVSSLEVELTLLDHPGVEEAAVIGVPAELTEEDVLAFVVLNSNHHVVPEDLRLWCAERMADYKVPRYIQIVDSLPKTATQKVEKGTLRRRFVDPAVWYDHESSSR